MRYLTRTQCNSEKFAKKILGENEIESVLRRLDRLTLDEARVTASQTLEAVYRIVQDLRVVMDGEKVPSCLFVVRFRSAERLYLRI